MSCINSCMIYKFIFTRYTRTETKLIFEIHFECTFVDISFISEPWLSNQNITTNWKHKYWHVYYSGFVIEYKKLFIRKATQISYIHVGTTLYNNSNLGKKYDIKFMTTYENVFIEYITRFLMSYILKICSLKWMHKNSPRIANNLS